jgi:hypothetical protein
MPSNTDQALDHYANDALRMESSVTELNMRIARLAIALGLRLDQAQDVHRVLSHVSDPDAHALDGQHHRDLSWKELRGLLVMRYDLEKHLIDDLGIEVTRQILEDVELHMTVAGFQPGSDGVALELKELFPSSS